MYEQQFQGWENSGGETVEMEGCGGDLVKRGVFDRY